MRNKRDFIGSSVNRWVDFVLPGQTVAAWFSCGAASAVAVKRLLDKVKPGVDVRVLNIPIADEHPDNRRFLRDCEKWFGCEIECLTSDAFPSSAIADVFDSEGCMSFANGYAPCTNILKKQVRHAWEAVNRCDWLCMGFTWEEKRRYERFLLTERSNLLPVLISARLTKADCWQTLTLNGIKLPQMYLDGFPNANCIGCVKATSPTYWNLVREKYPSVFDARAAQSRRLGCRLVRVKGERVFLDELEPDARGAELKSLDFECGIFCEERQTTIFEMLD